MAENLILCPSRERQGQTSAVDVYDKLGFVSGWLRGGGCMGWYRLSRLNPLFSLNISRPKRIKNMNLELGTYLTISLTNTENSSQK